MTADLWAACDGPATLRPLAGTLIRIVESQVQVATHRLVSTLEEQALLEDLLESVKPPFPAAAQGLHYLLATPFRYPPLRHGSRFGRRHEPSLFYGSLSLSTVLAEAAYYRLVFWHGMAVPPKSAITTQHTVFSVGYGGDRGIRLQHPPFETWQAALTHPADYSVSQALGTAMREAGVQAFEFVSARDSAGGLNVALFGPGALTGRRPESSQNWLAETWGEQVGFYCHEEARVHHFQLEAFKVDGRLPVPAA
ncbi:MAG: RES domain-containing protein [Methylococcaceae bacterium]|nr:RES domain-containing protein [Methylococcaceae bacterium]